MNSRAWLCLTAVVVLLGSPCFSTSLGQTVPATPTVSKTNSLASDPKEAVAYASITRWKPIFRGVEACEGTATKPRPTRVCALRIDLHEPTIDFLVTPSNGDQPKDVGARSTSEFLSEFKCQAAINGSVFDVFAKKKGDPMDIEGLSLSRGDAYSPVTKWDSLLISTNHQRVWIVSSLGNISGAYNGLSGYLSLLIDGRNNGSMTDRHPRSAAGISRDGRYLILMAVDGRQPGYSEGASTAETAEWIRKLGAYQGLNLDGGGSTTLVVEGPDGRPQVLNRPCGPPIGTERRVANHLGVFARPLDKSR